MMCNPCIRAGYRYLNGITSFYHVMDLFKIIIIWPQKYACPLFMDKLADTNGEYKSVSICA